MHMYELTERMEEVELYGPPTKIDREFLQVLIDNPAILPFVAEELRQMVVAALASGECRTNA